MKKTLSILFLGLISTISFAQNQQGNQSNDKKVMAPEFKAAVDACKSQAGENRELMKSCMDAKGFKRPEHPMGEKRELTPELKSAIEACRSQAGENHDAMKSCMDAKGFKRPEHPMGGKEPMSSKQNSQNNIMK